MSAFGVISIIAVIAIAVIGISYLAVIAFFICYYKKMQNYVLEDKSEWNEGIVFTADPEEKE